MAMERANLIGFTQGLIPITVRASKGATINISANRRRCPTATQNRMGLRARAPLTSQETNPKGFRCARRVENRPSQIIFHLLAALAADFAQSFSLCPRLIHRINDILRNAVTQYKSDARAYQNSFLKFFRCGGWHPCVGRSPSTKETANEADLVDHK